MKRRDFLSGISIGAIGSTAGCIDIPTGIVSDNPNTTENENVIPEEKLYLGSGEQISLRVFDIDLDYDTIETSAYAYNDEVYSLEQFGTIVASQSSVDELEQNLSEKDILPDPRLTLNPSEFTLSNIENPQDRSDITIQRNLERGVVVEYIVETDNGEVTSEPEIDVQNLVDQTPSSASGIVQFDRKPYNFTIPIGVEVVVF